MRGDVCKAFVRGEQRQLVPNAELRKNRVDRADLNPRAAAAVAKLSGVYVVLAIRGKQRKGAEAIDDLRAVTRPGETLEELLEHKPGRDYGLSALESALQGTNFG